MNTTQASQRGLSVIELLVVVGIMGIILLVSTPNFLTMRQTYKMRTSSRNFNTEARAVRQRAISNNVQTKITWTTSGYTVAWRPLPTTTTPNPAWTTIHSRDLEEPIKVESTGFANFTGDADTSPDIVFRQDGTIANMPTDPDDAMVHLRSGADIPKKDYYIRVSAAGKFQVCSNPLPAACIE